MTYNKKLISESEKFTIKYNELLQKVKLKLKVSNSDHVGLSKAKLSRLYNGQFDILTLIEVASVVGYNTDLNFYKRK